MRITQIYEEEAENILQEVFIKAYKNLYSYDHSFSFSSWIYRITHNMVIDYHRTHNWKMDIALDEESMEGIAFQEFFNREEQGDYILEKKELAKKISDILNHLDKKYRDVLVLKYLEGKNYEEISDILKIPEWTVATYLNRAKKQFWEYADSLWLDTYL